MENCPVCKKQSHRDKVEVQFPGAVLSLTKCADCGVIIGAETREFKDPVAHRPRKSEERFAEINRRLTHV